MGEEPGRLKYIGIKGETDIQVLSICIPAISLLALLIDEAVLYRALSLLSLLNTAIEFTTKMSEIITNVIRKITYFTDQSKRP